MTHCLLYQPLARVGMPTNSGPHSYWLQSYQTQQPHHWHFPTTLPHFTLQRASSSSPMIKVDFFFLPSKMIPYLTLDNKMGPLYYNPQAKTHLSLSELSPSSFTNHSSTPPPIPSRTYLKASSLGLACISHDPSSAYHSAGNINNKKQYINYKKVRYFHMEGR